MTTPNHAGWTDDRAGERFEKRRAEAIAYDVFNASALTDEEIKALESALEACATDPAHILNAEQYPFDRDEIVARELAPKTAAFISDLGTNFTISGGEVMELDGHLESSYDEANGDMPL